MPDFIKRAAGLVYERHKENLKSVAVIFPSRRAGLYFRKELSALIENPVWSPAVFSLNDFVSKHSELDTADTLTLVFELYESYSKYLETESFDEFYPWGEMLLKDFDVIDKYMVDADLLFKSIKDEKEIEQAFPIEAAEQAELFWESIIKLQKKNEYKDKFIEIWSHLNSVYRHFRESLLGKKIAYEGLSIRKLAENISGIELPYEKIHFAGFNSLNKCEKEIFLSLINRNAAETLFDADKYFVDDKKQEAGHFLRRNLKVFRNGLENETSGLAEGKKNINIIGSSLSSGMVKSFGYELKKFVEENPGAEKNTAVILPDENILLPALYSIPENAKDINITMGLPFRSTPLFALIRIIQKLQNGKIYEKGKYRFYHGDVIRLLLHPYVKFLFPEQIFGAVRKIRETNLAYIEPQSFLLDTLEKGNSRDILKLAFKPVSEVNEIISYISGLCDMLTLKLEEYEGNESNKIFQLEYLFFLSSNLNRLRDIIEERNTNLNRTTFWNLLIQQLNSSRIVFTGEPMKGIQVMGLLESRNIKFENVFILSMNEGVMPAGDTFNSYIPYSLRKAFGLPTFEENDSINAYYIYSLISKAENIFLFYNAEIGSDVKEKSRYILQIENELKSINSNLNVRHTIASYSLKKNPDNGIVIRKDESIIKAVNENVKRISPSDLNSYINCTLQFYFRNVLKLKSEEEVEEILSAASFGTVFHEIARQLYKPYIGKTVGEKDIDEIAGTAENDYDKLFEDVLNRKEELRHLNLIEKGRNALYKSVIKKLLNRFFVSEKTRVPFKVVDLEKWCETGISVNLDGTEHGINLAGKVDRIDEKETVFEIIDYKTGDSKLKAFKNDDKFYENLFLNPDYKANLQTLFYAYLLSLTENYGKVNAGIYALKEIATEGLQLMAEKFFNPEDIKLFGEELKNKITEIFNPEIPFAKTDDAKRCEYCDYKSICGR